jgi:MFS family permease
VARKTDRVYYGWVIVAVSFFTLFFTLGTRHSSGLFYVVILEECGWGRAATAGAFSLAMLMHGLFAIVTGTLIDRFGPRTLFPIGATFLAVGLAAASRINAIWHLYLFFGVVMGIGINTLSFAPHMSRIPKWFIRRGGLASGLVVSGTGLGTMVMSPFIQFMIDTIGWRSAFLTLAVIAITVVVPMTALFHRRSPEDVGQFPDGITPDSHGIQTLPPKESPGDTRSPNLSRQWTLRTALCTRTFWWVALMNFSAGFVVHMLVVHQAAHVVDVGYNTTLAALVVGLVGLLRSPGGILCGFLSDRAGREIAYTLGSSALFVGILLFLFARDTTAPWLIYGFVILYGLGSGSLGPIYAATIADLFPGNSIGRIFGTLSIGFGLGGALGPYVGGYFYDHGGSYTLPFLLGMLSIGIGVLGIWVAAPRHRRTLKKQRHSN